MQTSNTSSPSQAHHPWPRWGRLACALLLVITATNHALLAARGVGDVARHECFVAINVALGLLLVFRPRWARLPAALLSVQQLTSHGSELLRSIGDPSAAFDWASLGVLIFFPALLWLLGAERRIPGAEVGTSHSSDRASDNWG